MFLVENIIKGKSFVFLTFGQAFHSDKFRIRIHVLISLQEHMMLPIRRPSKGLVYLIIRRNEVFHLPDLVECRFGRVVGLRGRHEEDIAIRETDGSRSSANLEEIGSEKGT